jgi:hypothetical protein
MIDPSRVRVSGPLEPFAAGFVRELLRQGWSLSDGVPYAKVPNLVRNSSGFPSGPIHPESRPSGLNWWRKRYWDRKVSVFGRIGRGYTANSLLRRRN